MRSRRSVRLALASVVFATALPAARSAAQERGVTLYRDRDRRGPSMTFTEDEPNLARTRFGSRKASSIAVPRGCTAVLYDEPWFRGRHTTFQDDDNNLKNTEVGEDRAASIRVDCGEPRDRERDRERERDRDRGRGRWDREGEHGRGVTLFRDRDLEGPGAFFDRDVPDLDDTELGNRAASSVDVSPGCVAILYERTNYRGRRTEFRERDNNLRNTSVGEDTVSSLQVRCR